MILAHAGPEELHPARRRRSCPATDLTRVRLRVWHPGAPPRFVHGALPYSRWLGRYRVFGYRVAVRTVRLVASRDVDEKRKRSRLPDQDRLAAMLRDLRLRADLRQEDLAARLARPQSFVSSYERGHRELGFLDVRDICGALDVSFEGFVRRFERR